MTGDAEIVNSRFPAQAIVVRHFFNNSNVVEVPGTSIPTLFVGHELYENINRLSSLIKA